MATIVNKEATLRCPIPHGHHGVLSANLSIIFHVLIFALPVLFSLLSSKVEIPQNRISVNLVSVAAPSIMGDSEAAKIVTNKENNSKQIAEKQTEQTQPLKKQVKNEPPQVKKITKVKKFHELAPSAGVQRAQNKPSKTGQSKAMATKRQITANNSGNAASTIQILGENDYVRTTPPQYPRRAVNLGMQGTVIVKALINNTGKAEKIMIADSSGFSILDKSAVKAVSKWYFKPASLTGNFNKTWVKVPVKFVLM